METICKKIIVRGIVQGVFFRESTKRKATEFDITGSVKNRSDGSVEIIAYGAKNNLNQFIEWCNIGPSRAKVYSVNIEEISFDKVPETFEVVFE